MLRLQIGAEEVKELVAREEEKLIASAEKIKAEAEAMAEAATEAREAALDAALDNINRLADEAEAELAARRAAIEADAADLAAFEEDTIAARSEGLFFGGLHRPAKGEEAGGGGGTPSTSSGEDVAARMRAALARLPGDVGAATSPPPPPSTPPPAPSASSSASPRPYPPPETAAAIVGAARTEVRSSLRYGVWLVLCIAMGGLAVIDLFSVEPAFPVDAAALGLAGLLGWSAAREQGEVEAAAAGAVAKARAAAEREGGGKGGVDGR